MFVAAQTFKIITPINVNLQGVCLEFGGNTDLVPLTGSDLNPTIGGLNEVGRKYKLAQVRAAVILGCTKGKFQRVARKLGR